MALAPSPGQAAGPASRERALTFSVSGDGIKRASCRNVAVFSIEAVDAEGARADLRMEPLSVLVRGVQRTRSKLDYRSDGGVTVSWQPRRKRARSA